LPDTAISKIGSSMTVNCYEILSLNSLKYTDTSLSLNISNAYIKINTLLLIDLFYAAKQIFQFAD